MVTYSYIVIVKDGAGQTHRIAGTVMTDEGFVEATRLSMRQQYEKLTQGKAIYGKPGEGGCHGPYKILKLEIEPIS